MLYIFYYICTVHVDNIKVYYSATNAQAIVIKINIKIYIKMGPACLGVTVTPSSSSSLCVLAKVTVVKTVNYGSSACD